VTPPKRFIEKQERIEQLRRKQFARNSAKRVRKADRSGIPRDTSIAREQQYFSQHVKASSTRMQYAEELDFVEDDSPRGGYWILGPTKTHTPDCVAMSGKNWSWKTLRKINPMNRHTGCGCSIIPWREGKPIGENTLSNDELRNIQLSESRLGGSMGGKDPRKYGKIRSIVRTFGKWAGGKQSICAKRLAVEHPEICRGNCNALCAWLKDQWAGTTKWRGTGPKQKAEDAAIRAKAYAKNARFMLSADPPLTDDGLDALYELAKQERGLGSILNEAYEDARERGTLDATVALMESDVAEGSIGEDEMLAILERLDADIC
jgi:hypothetical protein